MSIFYMSDAHLGHYNIIRLCNRPFMSVEEMDETFIKNWNSVVKENDDVYIGGDFCFKSGKPATYYLKQLKGKKHLVIGNHDKALLKDPAARKMFVEIKESYDIYDNGERVIISHFPMVEWDGYFRNSIHLYGHIHNNTTNLAYKLMCQVPNAYNIGADILGFTPRTLKEIKELNDIFIKNNNS